MDSCFWCVTARAGDLGHLLSRLYVFSGNPRTHVLKANCKDVKRLYFLSGPQVCSYLRDYTLHCTIRPPDLLLVRTASRALRLCTFCPLLQSLLLSCATAFSFMPSFHSASSAQFISIPSFPPVHSRLLSPLSLQLTVHIQHV